MIEYKDILLKDLCVRLPYGVKISKTIENFISSPHSIRSINSNNVIIEDGEFEDGTPDIDVWDIENVKPYLFPLSSMTEEQRIEASFEFGLKMYKVNIFGNIESYSEIGDDIAYIDLENIERYINWLNKNHFDFRNLINKNLAIDATNLGIYK